MYLADLGNAVTLPRNLTVELPLADRFAELYREAGRYPLAAVPHHRYQWLFGIVRSILVPHTMPTGPDDDGLQGWPRASVLRRDLLTQLVFAEVLRTEDTAPLRLAAPLLFDALRDTRHFVDALVPMEEGQVPWIEAIRYIRAYETQTSPHWSPRHVSRANAARFFANKGIPIQVSGTEIGTPDVQGSRSIAQTVRVPFGRLGSLAMEFLQQTFERRYDPVRKHVNLHPELSMMSERIEPSIPLGYLYRIALQHLHVPPARMGRKQLLDSALTASRHLGALVDAEPWSPFESLGDHYPADVIRSLGRVVLYDQVFALPQMRQPVVEALLRDVVVPVADQLPGGPVWRPDHILALLLVLRGMAENPCQGTVVQRSEVEARLAARLFDRHAAEMLVHTFSLDRPCRNYYSPGHGSDAEALEAALVQLDGSRLWIPPAAFLGAAFYQRAFRLLANGRSNFNTEVGRKFELHMAERLAQRGILCLWGVMKRGRQVTGDVDLAIETDRHIVLFEMKAKALRTESRANDTATFFIDIAETLVHGVTQLSKCELRLLQEDSITLPNGVLELRGREVLKVVLTIADFGGLHDTMTMRRGLEALAGVEIALTNASSSSQTRRVGAGNRDLVGLRSVLSKLVAVAHNPYREHPYDNIFFHNLGFIEELLQHSATGEELVENLRSVSRINFSTRNPGFEFEQLRRIRAQATAEQQLSTMPTYPVSPTV